MDIEQLLRRMMQGHDDREWTEGDGDNEPGWGGPRREIKMPKVPKLAIVLGFVVFLILIGFSGIVEFYTDLLWFGSLGYATALWRRVLPQFALFGVVAALTFAAYALNWRIAVRIGTDEFRKSTGDDKAILVKPLHVTLAAAVFAVMAGLGAYGDWPQVLQFLHRVPFGNVDPVFGRDVGFYIFSLPFFRILQRFLLNLALISLAGSAIVYMLCRALRSEGTKVVLVRRARFHLFSLAALFAFLFGVGLWMSRYSLLYSPSGIVHGMGYTDFFVKLPALTIMSLAAMAASVLLFVNFFKPMWKLSAVVVGAMLALGVLAQSVLPSLVQNYIVKPNEYEREKKFLEYHIASTRRAFALDGVRTLQVTPAPEVTAQEMYEDSETVENIRLWDYGPLLRTYKQLQEIRTYYDFNDIDIDRYEIDGKNRQVMLSIRELDPAQLQNRTWVNTHLEFTHGYGVVMNPVNEMEEGGLPVFFMKDLPPKSSVPIRIDRPEIYYGEKPNTYALVRTDVREFDYPMGDSNVRSTYEGTGGVEIGSLARRLLYAIKFRDSEILFTDSLRPESRVLYNRNVRQAILTVAPFLILDEDIYPVIIDGKIFWVQDAYTASASYPYSRPLPRNSAIQAGLAAYANVNYIRNSVKITVDAYNGDMTFYVTDPTDPIVRNWMNIFPELFTPQEEIPDDLRAHFRYPEEYFEVQSEIYRIYHMTDTNTYYNREDVWMTTPQGRDRRIRPNYVTMQLMDETRPEFTLIAPFMPMGRNNLIGWMAARCDGKHYGELVVYQFPKQELVYGPPQIEALIDQNTTISSQLSLWSQHGSDVIRGDLLVIPIGDSLLYVQPLYLRAERGDLPELKRIILSTGGRLAWGETFEEAVHELFGQRPATATPEVPPTERAERETQQLDEKHRETTGENEVAELAKRARTHYENATEASRNGDWARYGEELSRLEDILRRLERITEITQTTETTGFEPIVQ
ncbi:UPF0182 family protein [Synergistaceae bacterium OttesenSCG-928-I11]|nr:UPF0182 family protein [Synergistaceae bacterium OttesenSCG-928-I11]